MKKKNIQENKNKLESFVHFIFGHNRRLNHIVRFSTRLRNYDENVAAHSFYVTLYAVALTDISKELGINIDKNLLIRKALFHDLEESASGDVITLFKKQMTKAYNKLSELSILTVFKDLPDKQKEEYSQEWRTHSDGVEGWIIKIADDLEGMIYCQEQINSGNIYFKDILNDYLTRIEKLTDNTELKDLSDYLKEIIKTDNSIKLHYDSEHQKKS